jgi:hypothetical protein
MRTLALPVVNGGGVDPVDAKLEAAVEGGNGGDIVCARLSSCLRLLRKRPETSVRAEVGAADFAIIFSYQTRGGITRFSRSSENNSMNMPSVSMHS